jgi:hypothetical protein
MVNLRDCFRGRGIRYFGSGRGEFNMPAGIIESLRIVLAGALEKKMEAFTPEQRADIGNLLKNESMKPYLVRVIIGKKKGEYREFEDVCKTEPAFQFSKTAYKKYLKIVSPPKPAEPSLLPQNPGAGEGI